MARNEPRIWQIVAYHNNSEIDVVAELERHLGIVAIGWYVVGNLKGKKLYDKKTIKEIQSKLKQLNWDHWKSAPYQLRRFRDEVKKRDFVILYKKKGVIACVGEVTSDEYIHDKENLIGNKNGYLYPNQKQVKWFKQINFDKSCLPKKFKSIAAGNRLKAIQEVKSFSAKELRQALRKIPKSKNLMGLPVNEEKAKEHLYLLLGKKFNTLGEKMKLIKAEYAMNSGRDRVDFLAIDENSGKVKIEVKTTADLDALTQLKRYVKHGEKGILLANEFDDKCKKAILQSRKHNIRGFSCKSKLIFDEIR